MTQATSSTASQTGVDPLTFRRTLGRFATGVTVVTTAHEELVHGMTANAFMSVSLDPPLVVVSVDKRARMHELLNKTQRYGVSVLACDQELTARHFAGRPQPGFKPNFRWVDGLPLLDPALARMACRIVDAYSKSDHTLFFGQVYWLEYNEGEPLVFFGGAYRSLDAAPYSSNVLW